jgi:SAM-dependent methyltransferase
MFIMKAQAITPYDETFFNDQIGGALRSARAVIPEVLRLVPAKSIVDIGCGQGAWLKACLENGVETIVGLDGDYVNRDKLLIDREQFQAFDLQRPIPLTRRFDLAMCLEVAEHLPAHSARGLVGSLAAAAPFVLFSAALPGQGGTSHINEQWPFYWEQLFTEQGMKKFDVIRPLIWNNRSVDPWYRQNLYIYSRERIDAFESMDHFEPDFYLVSARVMNSATFGWSSRVLKYLPLLRGIQGMLSRPR